MDCPFPSLKFQVTTVVPGAVIGKVVVVVPVIVPAHASVVVGASGVTSHCPVKSAKAGVNGATVSSIITF
jgi:hypothetical protein